MAEIDAITKEYMEDDATFADAFNFLLFDGAQVIKPENLKPLDPNELTILEEGEEKPQSAQRYRDLLKQAVIKQDGKFTYLLLGIENQSAVHYAMPVRCMLYDALRYDRQIKAIAKKHQEPAGDSASLLSGFRKEDRLLPVVTLTIYFGPEPWDGPTDLHSMLDLEPSMFPLVDNYRLKLIAPAQIEDEAFRRFQTELSLGLHCAKYAKSIRKLREVVQNNPAFHKVSRRTALLIRAVTKKKISIPKEKETVDMIEEVNDFVELGREEGREEGIGIGVEKGIGIGREEGREEERLRSISTLMKSMSLSASQAMEALGIPEDLRSSYLSLLS